VPAEVEVSQENDPDGAVPQATVPDELFAAHLLEIVTLDGVIAPKVRVMAGVVVEVATEPETPFAVVTDTLLTVAEEVLQVEQAITPGALIVMGEVALRPIDVGVTEIAPPVLRMLVPSGLTPPSVEEVAAGSV
jgi:hypothetical protein